MAHSDGWQRRQLLLVNAWHLFPIVTDSSVQLLLLENNPSLCTAFEGQFSYSVLPSLILRVGSCSPSLRSNLLYPLSRLFPPLIIPNQAPSYFYIFYFLLK